MGTTEETKLCDLSSQYIFNETAGSMLLLLSSFMEQRTSPNHIFESLKIHEDITDIREKINKYLSSLKDILSDDKRRKESLDGCFLLKKKLTEIYGVIFGYYAKLNNIAEMVSDEIAMRKYKEDENNKDKKVELSLFYSDCADFLQHAETPEKFRDYSCKLFKCIPMKMTRQRYFDLLEKSLTKAFADSSEDEITKTFSLFKKTAAPELMSDYGKYFTDIADALKGKDNLKVFELSDEKLQTEFDDVSQLLDTVHEIEDYFQLTLSDINSLIILFFMGYSFDELTENEYGYADCYHKVCELMETPEDTAFDEILSDSIENYVEPLIDKANELNKKIMDILSKINDVSLFSADTLKTISAEGFVRSCFYEDINDNLLHCDYDHNLPAASPEFVKKTVSDFTAYIKEYLILLPAAARKYTMQSLLGALPIDLNFDEVMAYIKEGIDNASSFEQELLIVDKIGTVFADNGMTFDDEEYEYECGCGHDHDHHDNECGCGHDHEH